MSKFSIFSHTSDSFVEAVFANLSKGRIHARLIYEEFFRQGSVSGNSAAFSNAKGLLNAILDLVDFNPSFQQTQEKTDGLTGKILLRTFDDLEVETVLIPMQAGGTVCVSSQVGCRMGCAFCETGKMGLLRNLTPEEIVSQIFIARHVFKFQLRNIVFMGMGEPFDNYDAVMQAVRILSDSNGLAIGPRHITVSTSGSVEGIYKLIQEKNAPNLAVSINAVEDEGRDRLMPVNKKHNMQELYQAMHDYGKQTGRQILTAYVLLKGINDTADHAGRLAKYLQGLDVKINLIPYNPMRRDRFSAPEPEVTDAFALVLRQYGYRTLLRRTKGRDIMAACGQLGNRKKHLAIAQSE